ncbi:MAG: UDP-N-acetylglucosamine 2-epimerase (non-hydrolyzing) [Oscillospiraceae bacterium]|nr:UDP-N-acetylglucosamine 2-epimerase (non-hydrolyzing) [Oscillospiraceae bacterium]
MKKKVMVVFGTRPEAIKMCPLVKALRESETLETVVCVTGQHREMLQQVLDIFGIEPEENLAIMKPGQDLYDITTAVLSGMRGILKKHKPDLVHVHGDTSTAYASALSAFYQLIPVGHVEAGLRTWNLRSPYPEEMNRQGIDILSELLFAPTQASRRNLLSEGKDDSRIFVTGNTGIDALRTTVREGFSHPVLDWAKGSRLIVLTAHRRENLGEPMRQMFRAIRRIVDKYADIKVVYPVHLNPAVRAAADEAFSDCDRVRLVEPMTADVFHNIMAYARLILTDSGGIQEEAPSLGKPVLVMRDTTERPEGVEAGTLKLVGTGEEAIFSACETLLNDPAAYDAMAKAANPYGDGHASERIRAIIEDWFKKQE